MNKGILTPEIISAVWKQMSDKGEIMEYLPQNEAAVNSSLNEMKDDAIQVLLKIRSRQPDNMSIEEVVKRIAPAFFSAGILATKLARDLADQDEVPNINKYIKDYLKTEKVVSEAEAAVAKRRSSTV